MFSLSKMTGLLRRPVQSSSQITIFWINIQWLNMSKQSRTLLTVLNHKNYINIFLDSCITDQGQKKIKHIDMHLLGGYNTVSTNTAQRGIYILIKKSLGQVENVNIIDNSTFIFDIVRIESSRLPPFTHRQMRIIIIILKKWITSY